MLSSLVAILLKQIDSITKYDMPHNKLFQNYKVQSDLYKTATNKVAIYQSPNLFDT